MPELIATLLDDARRSPRGRQHLNLHHSYDDPCQRFLNAILPHGYIRPHRHMADPKVETLVAVRGIFAVVEFDEAGGITRTVVISADPRTAPEAAIAAEISPRDWHTVLALTGDAVLLEVKAGPFDPAAAKELAEWAPAEGSPDAPAYLERLRAAVR